MSEPTVMRDLIPPDLLDTRDLLVAVTGRSEARLVADRHSLPELADHTYDELRDAGLTPAAARRLVCALELGRRLHIAPLLPGALLKSSQQIFDAFNPRLRDLKLEQFWGVYLDARSRVIREELISQGILTASLVHPREVFRPGIRCAAASIVLLHNHPSQDPTESPEDVAISRRLCAVGELCGIRIADFVVIGGGRYVSFLERGLVLG